MKFDSVLSQELDTLHHLRMCSFTTACFSMGIVDEGWSIDAQSKANVIALYEGAPLVRVLSD